MARSVDWDWLKKVDLRSQYVYVSMLSTSFTTILRIRKITSLIYFYTSVWPHYNSLTKLKMSDLIRQWTHPFLHLAYTTRRRGACIPFSPSTEIQRTPPPSTFLTVSTMTVLTNMKCTIDDCPVTANKDVSACMVYKQGQFVFKNICYF